MTLVAAWLAFPLVLGLLSLGCGLVVDRLAGGKLPGVLLLPVGFATIVVATDLVTSVSSLATLATPVVIGLAAAGLALAVMSPQRSFRPGVWTLVSVLGVFLVYAAPTVFSGDATFTGYYKLDDTATWLAIADRVLEHGRSLKGLPPSSYEATLQAYVGATGYPVGSVLPLGVGAKLVGQDVAWCFQPYLAFQAALLALGFQSILRGLIRSPWLRMLAIMIAAQPALLYGYSLWGSVKELVTVPLLALMAALVPASVRNLSIRSLIPLALAVGAILAVLNVGGGVWIGIALLPALVLVLVPRLGLAPRLGALSVAGKLTAFAVLTVLVSLPTITTASSFFTNGSPVLTSSTEFGNLFHRLSVLQIAGIWPVGDFRVRPHDLTPTKVAIGVLVVAAAWGIWHAVRRRMLELPLYVLISVGGCAVLVHYGSPWVDAKALATASPGLLLAGAAGVALAFQSGRRVEALLVGAAIAGGVVWSNVLAYQEVWLAPRDQLAEIELIGKRFAGQGPALITDFSVYGDRHFLRRLDPEGASELRRRYIFLQDGKILPTGGFADIDEFQLQSILVYRTLVLGRSPVASRPPSIYHLVWKGRFNEVWQRPEPAAPTILRHLSLGSETQPAALASCKDVLDLAALAQSRKGELATVMRNGPDAVVDLSRGSHPSSWVTSPGGGVYVSSSGTIETSFRLQRRARYGVWVEGSFPGHLTLSIDGHRVGSFGQRIEHQGAYLPFGDIELGPGVHRVTLHHEGRGWRPGSGARLVLPLGPLVLGRETADLPVTYVQPAQARSLCGKRLDWIEAVAPS